MLKPKISLIAVIAAGVAAGVVHGLSLSRVFDRYTGLPQPNHPLTWALIGITALAAVISLFIKLDVTGRTGGGALKLCMMLGCVALGVSGILDFVDLIGGNTTVTQLVLSGLGLISAAVIMLLVTSANTHKLTLGLFATVPVFWSFFWFITVFADNSSNPILSSYIFEFLAVLFVMAVCYTFAGFYFGLERKRRLGALTGMGLFLVLTNIVSPVTVRLIAPDTSLQDGITPAGMLRIVFALLYLLTMPGMASAAVNIPDAKPENDEEADENAEDKTV